jgi:hypothetical protein
MESPAELKPGTKTFSRASVNVALILGLTSYWVLFLTPLLICLLMIWVLIAGRNSIWNQAGSLFATVVVLMHSGILFLILYRRVRRPRIWGNNFGLTSAPPGVRLNISDAPELFAIAERYRQEAGLSQLPEIWMDLSGNATNFAYRVSKGSGLTSAILIGLPTLSVVSAADLELLVGLNVGVISISHGLRMRAAGLRAFASKSPFVFRTLFGGVNYFKVVGTLCNAALIRAEKYAFQVASGNGRDVKTAIEAFRKVAAGYQRFWMEHGNMMLHSGHVAPLLEGFADYWTTLYSNEVGATLPPRYFIRSGGEGCEGRE